MASPNSKKPGADVVDKFQAATVLDVSSKTIEAWASEGKIRMTKAKIGGVGAHRSLYAWEDVERIYRQRFPDGPPITMPKPGTKVLRVQGVPMSIPAAVPISDRMFLSIPEAAELSGLPMRDIQRFIDAGDLPTTKTGAGLRVKRSDLERLSEKL